MTTSGAALEKSECGGWSWLEQQSPLFPIIVLYFNYSSEYCIDYNEEGEGGGEVNEGSDVISLNE